MDPLSLYTPGAMETLQPGSTAQTPSRSVLYGCADVPASGPLHATSTNTPQSESLRQASSLRVLISSFALTPNVVMLPLQPPSAEHMIPQSGSPSQ